MDSLVATVLVARGCFQSSDLQSFFCRLLGKSPLTVLTSLVLITVVLGCARSNSKKTVILINPADLDIGDIVQGNSKQVELSVVNESDDTAVVKDVSTSCGCIAARIAPAEIKPHKRAELTATMLAQERGKFGATVTITCRLQHSSVVHTAPVQHHSTVHLRLRRSTRKVGLR